MRCGIWKDWFNKNRDPIRIPFECQFWAASSVTQHFEHLSDGNLGDFMGILPTVKVVNAMILKQGYRKGVRV